VSRLHTALAVAAVLALAACAERSPHPSDHATSHRRFDDVEYWQTVFDDPSRDAWQRPAEVVAATGLRPGDAVADLGADAVADLGAGTGYFMPHLAARVGPAGIVYAIEPERALVEHLRRRAEREGLAQVRAVLATRDDARLQPGSVDVILVVDTYHHIDDRVGYFGRLRSALRPGGRIVIVDWQKRPLPMGPPPAHKIAREQVEAEMERAGYRRTATLDTLPYQYVVVFEPAGE